MLLTLYLHQVTILKEETFFETLVKFRSCEVTWHHFFKFGIFLEFWPIWSLKMTHLTIPSQKLGIYVKEHCFSFSKLKTAWKNLFRKFLILILKKTWYFLRKIINHDDVIIQLWIINDAIKINFISKCSVDASLWACQVLFY